MPRPALVSPPTPVMGLAIVSVVAASTSNVPPAEFKLTLRGMVNVAVLCRAPPLKLRWHRLRFPSGLLALTGSRRH